MLGGNDWQWNRRGGTVKLVGLQFNCTEHHWDLRASYASPNDEVSDRSSGTNRFP